VTGYEAMGASAGDRKALSEEDDNEALNLERTAYQNLAITAIKMEDYKGAVEFSDKALKVDPAAWKAKMRKGQALMKIGDLDAAQSLFNEALVDTDNEADRTAIKTEIKRLDVQLKQFDKRQGSKLARAFGADV